MLKVISFDIFQTLVDVNQRVPQIWKGILQDDYDDESGRQGCIAVLKYFPFVFEQAMSANHFYTMEEVYLECAKKMIKEKKLNVTPDTIVYHLLYQHSQAPLYSEVKECLENLHKQYHIILSSDSNHLMIDELLPRLVYDQVFISDDLESYKNSKDGKFFTSVLEELKVQPEEILHIGDSSSDVLGAARHGIHTCWLNRDNRKWNHTVLPEYEIHNLSELWKEVPLKLLS